MTFYSDIINHLIGRLQGRVTKKYLLDGLRKNLPTFNLVYCM